MLNRSNPASPDPGSASSTLPHHLRYFHDHTPTSEISSPSTSRNVTTTHRSNSCQLTPRAITFCQLRPGASQTVCRYLSIRTTSVSRECAAVLSTRGTSIHRTSVSGDGDPLDLPPTYNVLTARNPLQLREVNGTANDKIES